MVHQRGVVDVTHWLRGEEYAPTINSTLENASGAKVGFLMPCHSTPWGSHLLEAVEPKKGSHSKSWFLTCEPPITLFGADRVAYRDEADRFYDDPLGFMEENFPSVPRRPTDAPECEGEKRYQWPDKLVMFQQV